MQEKLGLKKKWGPKLGCYQREWKGYLYLNPVFGWRMKVVKGISRIGSRRVEAKVFAIRSKYGRWRMKEG